jgi:hypothetical protein
MVPVVAFGAAFLAGAATKPPVHTPAHLAPAAGLTAAGVSVVSVTALPTPAALVTPRAPHKPKAVTHTTGAVRSVLPSAPVHRAPIRVTGPPPTSSVSSSKTSISAPGSGGSSLTTTSSGTTAGVGSGTVSGSG